METGRKKRPPRSDARCDHEKNSPLVSALFRAPSPVFQPDSDRTPGLAREGPREKPERASDGSAAVLLTACAGTQISGPRRRRSEADNARLNFLALPASDQDELIRFLEDL